jgi:hypothetical protein
MLLRSRFKSEYFRAEGEVLQTMADTNFQNGLFSKFSNRNDPGNFQLSYRHSNQLKMEQTEILGFHSSSRSLWSRLLIMTSQRSIQSDILLYANMFQKYSLFKEGNDHLTSFQLKIKVYTK